MDDSDKRVGEKAVPDNALQYMNAEQLLTYRGMQGFGWHLKYLRHPLFQSPVLIMIHPDTHEIGVLEEDGTFNNEPNITLRDS